MKPTILITGGAGYIGSHTVYTLIKQEYPVVILDLDIEKNKVPGAHYIQGDCGDRQLLHTIFSQYAIDTVMHFAAYIEVGESVKNPLMFYENNVAKSVTLLQTLCAHGIKKVIFSSSCAVYGIPKVLPLTEEHSKNPINPYGTTKLMVEKILEDVARAQGLHYVVLRYFNAAGALPEEHLGERHTPESHLIPVLLRASHAGTPFTVFGTDLKTADGSCVRDYLHVLDIADAHARALAYLTAGEPSACFNLGTGTGCSVKQMIAMVEKVTGKQIHTKYGQWRRGDPATLVACPDKAQKILGWAPQYSALEHIVATAYAFDQAWYWGETIRLTARTIAAASIPAHASNSAGVPERGS